MTAPASSSPKVHYNLRPRKQVERLMMLHVFQMIAEAGFPISTYRYAGFGGIFFIDFVLFRRFLGITDMVSIEHDKTCEKRVHFNRPFKDITILMKSATEYITSLNRDKPHILWLDYDQPIKDGWLSDLETAAGSLSRGSVLIATFNVDFIKANDIRIEETPIDKLAKAWFGLFKEECGIFFDPTWSVSDFNAGYIANRTIKVASNAILSGLNMRGGITFEPLFNFHYADGHEMLTIGGIICSENEERDLRKIEWKKFNFVRRNLSLDPFRIDFPVLTPRERLHIDSNMTCDPDWLPEEFEIDPDEIQKYRKVHRYCPLYAELLLR